MRSPLPPIPARIYCAIIGIAMATASAVFILVPYALQVHPGEAMPVATADVTGHAT